MQSFLGVENFKFQTPVTVAKINRSSFRQSGDEGNISLMFSFSEIRFEWNLTLCG